MTLELYWPQICPNYNSRVIIYDRKMFIRLATDVAKMYCWEWMAKIKMLRTMIGTAPVHTLDEVASYDWPPAWLVWIQLLYYLQITTYFSCLVESKLVTLEISQSVLLPPPPGVAILVSEILDLVSVRFWYLNQYLILFSISLSI